MKFSWARIYRQSTDRIPESIDEEDRESRKGELLRTDVCMAVCSDMDYYYENPYFCHACLKEKGDAGSEEEAREY